jgi:hypothetical protein
MPKIWTKGGKIITKNGMIVLCNECPCKKPEEEEEEEKDDSVTCTPKILLQQPLSGKNLLWKIPNSAKSVTPGSAHRWRIVEVTTVASNRADHILEQGGAVDDNGVLVGLKDFESDKYSYNIIARLEVGCINEKGVVVWPTQG